MQGPSRELQQRLLARAYDHKEQNSLGFLNSSHCSSSRANSRLKGGASERGNPEPQRRHSPKHETVIKIAAVDEDLDLTKIIMYKEFDNFVWWPEIFKFMKTVELLKYAVTRSHLFIQSQFARRLRWPIEILKGKWASLRTPTDFTWFCSQYIWELYPSVFNGTWTDNKKSLL